MKEIKIGIFIVVCVLFTIHLILLSFTNFYGGCIYSGEKVCKICIDDGQQTPCECEQKEICKTTLEMFILPIIMIFLAIINFGVGYE